MKTLKNVNEKYESMLKNIKMKKNKHWSITSVEMQCRRKILANYSCSKIAIIELRRGIRNLINFM